MQATLKQISIKPASKNDEGEVTRSEYANINFHVDLGTAEGKAEIMKLLSYLDNEEVFLAVTALQERIDFREEDSA